MILARKRRFDITSKSRECFFFLSIQQMPIDFAALRNQFNIYIVRLFHFSEKKVIDLEKPLLTGAFVDPTKVAQYTEKDYILPEIPPFSWLIKNPKVWHEFVLRMTNYFYYFSIDLFLYAF